jgi:hypothetical protein
MFLKEQYGFKIVFLRAFVDRIVVKICNNLNSIFYTIEHTNGSQILSLPRRIRLSKG